MLEQVTDLFTRAVNPAFLPDPTQLAVPGFVILILAEMVYGWKSGRTKFNGKDTAVSLIMGLGSIISGALFAFAALGYSLFIFETMRLVDLGHGVWVFILAFILDDLIYYWIHRAGHRMRWMWAAHVIHHSSQHYNLSTALRQTWTSPLTPGILFRTPLFVIGIDPGIVFFVAGLNLVYQFWIHTEAIDRMPRWFEAVMNTPSHHRVHHANNPPYLDANYAGVFIIWDKLFGSFIPEQRDMPVRYGLVQDLGTFNPLKVAFHEWVGLLKDWSHAKSWSERLHYLIKPPGWTPDGSRLTSDMLKTRWQQRQRLRSAQTVSIDGSLDHPERPSRQAAE